MPVKLFSPVVELTYVGIVSQYQSKMKNKKIHKLYKPHIQDEK